VLLKVQSGSINSYRGTIKKFMEEVIPDCSMDLLQNTYRKLLLDVYHLWVYHREDETRMFVMTSLNKDFFTDQNIFSVIGIYSPDGTNLEEWAEVIDTLKPFAKKFNCTKYEFLMVNKHIWHYIDELNPIVDARYCQINF